MADGSRAKTGLSANAEAARHIDEAIRAITLNYGDANGYLAQAREADPGCAMADILEAWLLALTKDGAQLARARTAFRHRRGRADGAGGAASGGAAPCRERPMAVGRRRA